MFLHKAANRAQFSSGKMTKVDLVAGESLFGGLNCFEAGQAHEAHVHSDQDKLYVVLEGEGWATVGDDQRAVKPGDLIFAAAGVSHGMQSQATGRLVVLTIFAPPPKS